MPRYQFTDMVSVNDSLGYFQSLAMTNTATIKDLCICYFVFFNAQSFLKVGSNGKKNSLVGNVCQNSFCCIVLRNERLILITMDHTGIGLSKTRCLQWIVSWL